MRKSHRKGRNRRDGRGTNGSGDDDDKTSDRGRSKATKTYLEINQKLERLRVNDVDKTANDRSVLRIKLNVRCTGHFSFKILEAHHRRNGFLFPPYLH